MLLPGDKLLIERRPLLEEQLLQDLGSREVQNARVSVGSDRGWLLELEPDRWRVFAPTGRRFHRVRSPTTGIQWFTTGDLTDSEWEGSLLTASVGGFLQGRGLLRVDAEFAIVTRETVRESGPEIFGRAAGGSSCLDSLRRLRGLPKAGLEPDSVELDRAGFVGSLREYQRSGVGWLRRLAEADVGGLLADEMGLGKTVQVIAYIALVEEPGHFLVVCPRTVIPNWVAEIRRFCPRLGDATTTDLAAPPKGRNCILVVSYEILARHVGRLQGVRFDALIADEAQKAKNSETANAKALRSVSASARFCLTGTPVENRVSDIWAHATFLNPDLETLPRFLANAFGAWEHNSAAAEASGVLLGRMLLRRTKADVGHELPPITDQVVRVDFDESERATYQHILAFYRLATRRARPSERSTLFFEALLRLKQCCSLPELLPSELNPHGLTVGSKIIACWDMLEDSVAAGEKVVLFAEFLGVLNQTSTELDRREIRYLRVDGSTQDRSTPIEYFQRPDGPPVLLATIRTTSLGVNLTAADRVIIFDHWWNPAVPAQAVARAHRIGRRGPVFVQRIVVASSIEEDILRLQDDKLDLLRQAVSQSEKRSLPRELACLIGLVE